MHVMNLYLLEVRETVGDRYETLNQVLVEATSPGYAKYHWHKQMNQQGSRKVHGTGTHGTACHEYVNDYLGLRAELESVREVNGEEASVLENVLMKIPGFSPDG